jgi:hypothetical protein
LPALLLLALSFLGVGALSALPGASDGPLAVQFAPWTAKEEALRAVAAAGGEIIAQGAWPSLLIARADGGDFVARLYRQGALVVIDAPLSGGCLPRQSRS